MTKNIFIILSALTVLTLAGCSKKSEAEKSIEAGKSAEVRSSFSEGNVVTTAHVSTASSVKTTAVKTTSKTSAKTTVKTTSASTAKSTEKKSGTQKSGSKKADVTTQAPRYGNEQDNNGNYQAGGNNGGQTQPQSQNTTASRKTEKPSQTQKKTTTAKKTEKPKPKPTEAPEPEPQGLSQADISEINEYIKQAAKSYGIGTECPDCNNEGAVILSGYVDPWNGYSWNTPIDTERLKDKSRIKQAVDSYINVIYNEWLNDGMITKDDLKKYAFLYVYWEDTGDGYYDLYLMW